MSGFNVENTQELARLFTVPAEQRDGGWREHFYAAVPDAALITCEPQVSEGPDKFPYLDMALPGSGPFTPFSITQALDFVLDNGLGIALFNDSGREGGPEWVFRYGDLLSYQLYGDFDGDPEERDRTGPPEPSAQQQLLVAAPSEAFLPARVRKPLGTFLHGVFHLPDPRIALVSDSETGLRSLMVNLTLDHYDGNEEKLRSALHYISWYLPRTYGVMAMPAEWSDSSFVSLL